MLTTTNTGTVHTTSIVPSMPLSPNQKRPAWTRVRERAGRLAQRAERRDDDGAVRSPEAVAPLAAESRRVTARIAKADAEVRVARAEARWALAELAVARRALAELTDDVATVNTLEKTLDTLDGTSACGGRPPPPSSEAPSPEERRMGAEVGVRAARDEMQRALVALRKVRTATGEGGPREERIAAAEAEVRTTQGTMRRALDALRDVRRRTDTADATASVYSGMATEEGDGSCGTVVTHLTPEFQFPIAAVTFHAIAEEILGGTN